MSAAVTPHAGALTGASVIVTRPASAAAPLVNAALKLGARVVRLPGLRLCPPDDDQAITQDLQRARTADAWIFTSPAAVRFAARGMTGFEAPLPSRVFAVGAGTARALARYAVEALAPSQQHDSEGLLALPDLQALGGQRIAIIDAPGGRDVIAPALTARGAQVTRIGVYRRAAPKLTRRHLESLEHTPLPWISLVSSGEALDHLHAALPPDLLTRWRAQAIVLSSERLATQAAMLGFRDRHVARSALVEDLLEAASAVLARRRL